MFPAADFPTMSEPLSRVENLLVPGSLPVVGLSSAGAFSNPSALLSITGQ